MTEEKKKAKTKVKKKKVPFDTQIVIFSKGRKVPKTLPSKYGDWTLRGTNPDGEGYVYDQFSPTREHISFVEKQKKEDAAFVREAKIKNEAKRLAMKDYRKEAEANLKKRGEI